MRSILILTCCLALASLGRAADQDNPKKKHADQAPPPQQQQVVKPGKHAMSNPSPGRHNVPRAPFRNVPAVQSEKKGFKGKHIDIVRNTQVEHVKFKEGVHIAGSENWKGKQYEAFRLYRPAWHDRVWWRHHHDHIIFVLGGWYFWDAGFWYPAWGYDPVAVYAWDGPIYAGTVALTPDQVVANVQDALRGKGYENVVVDGELGPITRAALADYQAKQGFTPTGAIDEPTLVSLGIA